MSLDLLPSSSSFCFLLLSSVISRSNVAFQARKFSMVTTVPWNATCTEHSCCVAWSDLTLWCIFYPPSLLPLLLFLSVVSLPLSCFSSYRQFHWAFPEQPSPRWKSSPFQGFLLPAGVRPNKHVQTSTTNWNYALFRWFSGIFIILMRAFGFNKWI